MSGSNKQNKDIVNKRAIALGYDHEIHDAPKVKAKGKGYVAEEIIKRAKESDVPIQEDRSLIELLSQLEINESIPAELYEVVAEIFAFIYALDREKRGKNS
ncbi:EscU/YscU/HrcU family type III secretion system export apparatus switch protein [Bacillus shivajii]|uniref:EscU/YscU/HrcU family type III secretion system export apparatus switch protein n=1 Tax=Bacillus shivajii TaxID=1983719 RepID=UPI001CFA9149|nr:EscU/YscU/HrcU family type III secretion system export apparatus switch protein [Bacillus shivajii]UCZ51739.1 EscU/YscU/HrcU family type III secretion system export apparatus switch protein [Bacillus shivajii]